ncbi:MAG: V-type ATP synthase subunit I [Acutalibacteraceae bacterium]|nr:V-type ATPase 116kDa subunit family protein [Oscillospiraceae bacterium]
MSIEKMKLVSFTGKTNKLDKIISKCLLNGDIHIEQADEYMGFNDILKVTLSSGADIRLEGILEYGTVDGKFNSQQAIQYMSNVLGFNTTAGENPYSAILQSVKELADEFGFNIEDYSGKNDNIGIDEDLNEYVVSVGGKVNELNEKRKQLQDQLQECEDGLSKFSHFEGLEIPIDELLSSQFVATRFGRMPKENAEKLDLAYSDNPYVLYIPCTVQGEDSWGAYLAPRDRADEIDKIFSALHFERMWIPEAVGSIDEIIKNLKENEEIITNSINECDEKIKEIFSSEENKLKAIYAQLKAKNAVFEVRKYAFILDNSFYMVGWVPAKKVKALVSKLTSFKGVEVETFNPEDVPEHTPPVKLKNSKLTRPYEYFVNMYGLPNYYDMDITFFVAIVYTFVFGVMFGDVGQGLVLAVGGFLAYKFKKMELGKILVPCGIASMIGGFVFGSVFGFEEALDPLYHAIGLKSKPVDVMSSVNKVLIFAIAVGVILVIAAMLLHTVISLKKKQIGEALFSENGVAGIIFYCCGASAIYSFMGGPALIPKAVLVPLMVGTLLILFCKEILIGLVDHHDNWKPDSIADFVLQNLFECLEYVLSYFSNTLSFLRVGAFVIVHASMMMVVFTLAGDTSSVKGIIVVVLGNIVVIALEGLLTGIQSLRLVFYEMFSRFHEGGGKPFRGFKPTLE